MAHLITGYAGYAHIKSSDEGAFNASFFGGGQYVMDFGNCFEGSIIDNNTVRILDGDGLMYGRHFRIEPNTYEDMVIETGTAGTNRIDLICMTYKKDANDETETAYLEVIKGTETAGTATVPAYTDGNILEGATLNQMPLYKVKLEGVVLKSIEPMFETLPSYEGLAKMYAARFEATCEELKKTFDLNNVIKASDVIDNLASTEKNKPLSADKGRELDGKFSIKGVSNCTLDSIVESSDPNVCNLYHGTFISGIAGVDDDNDVWIQVFKYHNYNTAKVIVYDVRSEKVMTISKLNGTYTSWKTDTYREDVVDHFLSTATNLSLSANKGRELKEGLDLATKGITSIDKNVSSGGRAYFCSPDGGIDLRFKCGIMAVHASADMLEYYAVILVTFINNGTNVNGFNILQETKFNAEFHYDQVETGMSIVNDNDKTVHVNAKFIQFI